MANEIIKLFSHLQDRLIQYSYSIVKRRNGL